MKCSISFKSQLFDNSNKYSAPHNFGTNVSSSMRGPENKLLFCLGTTGVELKSVPSKFRRAFFYHLCYASGQKGLGTPSSLARNQAHCFTEVFVDTNKFANGLRETRPRWGICWTHENACFGRGLTRTRPCHISGPLPHPHLRAETQ